MREWRKTTLSDPAGLGAQDQNWEARKREEFETERQKEVAALVFSHGSLFGRFDKILGVGKENTCR